MGIPIEIEVDSGVFDFRLSAFVARASRSGSDPVLSTGLVKAGTRLTTFYYRRFFRADATRGWPALAKSTERAKKRKGTYHKGILRDEDNLSRSFLPGAPNHVRRIAVDSITEGTADPKAKYHQEGTSRMPIRRVVVDAPPALIDLMTNEDLRPAVDRLVQIIFPQAA